MGNKSVRFDEESGFRLYCLNELTRQRLEGWNADIQNIIKRWQDTGMFTGAWQQRVASYYKAYQSYVETNNDMCALLKNGADQCLGHLLATHKKAELFDECERRLEATKNEIAAKIK